MRANLRTSSRRPQYCSYRQYGRYRIVSETVMSHGVTTPPSNMTIQRHIGTPQTLLNARSLHLLPVSREDCLRTPSRAETISKHRNSDWTQRLLQRKTETRI